MNVQFIKHSGQDEYAVLPIADYETLLDKSEQFDDVVAFDKAIRADEETLPSEMVKQLIEGENKIKVWRQYRGLTQSVLADKSGVAQAYIGQLETGKRVGTVEVMKSIAAALLLDIDDLV